MTPRTRRGRRSLPWSALTAAVLLVSVVGAASAQEVYRWVDAEGRVHYGDHPPDKSAAERVALDPAPDSAAAAELLLQLRRRVEASAESRAQDERERAAAAQARDAAQSVEDRRCRRARRDLVVLEWQWPVYRDAQQNLRLQWDGDTYVGPREYLDDTTRAAEHARTKDEIATACQYPNDAAAQSYAREEFIHTEVCSSMRAVLQELERPEAKTPRADLERKRKELQTNCGP